MSKTLLIVLAILAPVLFAVWYFFIKPAGAAGGTIAKPIPKTINAPAAGAAPSSGAVTAGEVGAIAGAVGSLASLGSSIFGDDGSSDDS